MSSSSSSSTTAPSFVACGGGAYAPPRGRMTVVALRAPRCVRPSSPQAAIAPKSGRRLCRLHGRANRGELICGQRLLREWARAGSHLSELDTGAGNRWPVAVAPKTITHVVASSRWKACRYAVRHATCRLRQGQRPAGDGGDRAAQGCSGQRVSLGTREDPSKTWAFGCREPGQGQLAAFAIKFRIAAGDVRGIVDAFPTPPTS